MLQLRYLPSYKGGSGAQYAPVGRVIAFDAVVLLCLGMVAVVAAAERWGVALLWAGAALFTGFFVGLLFGLPLGATAVAAKAGAAADTGPGAPNRTLLVEAAGWLSKFLAGATFAQAKNILIFLTNLSRSVGAYISRADSAHIAVLGGGVLFYFGTLGFLIGVLLPSIFLDGFR